MARGVPPRMPSAGPSTVQVLACALACATAYHIPVPTRHVTALLATGSSSAPQICKAVEGATASDGWCKQSCGNSPPICPPDICKCEAAETKLENTSSPASPVAPTVSLKEKEEKEKEEKEKKEKEEKEKEKEEEEKKEKEEELYKQKNRTSSRG